MINQAAQRKSNGNDLELIIAGIIILLLFALAVTQTIWYFHNERQLNQAAIQSPDYRTCKEYFAERILPDYLEVSRKQCRELTKWHLEQERGYFTHQNPLYPEKRYTTPIARRAYILKYRKEHSAWDDIQNSQWLP